MKVRPTKMRKSESGAPAPGESASANERPDIVSVPKRGAVVGTPPPKLAEFGLFNGVPHAGPLGVALIAIGCNGLGEEVGWRGFALPELQLCARWRHRPSVISAR